MPHKKKTGRAANGSGSIRERKIVTKDGKTRSTWEGRVTVGYDPVTGRQIQRSVSGKTKTETLKKMRQLAVEVDQGAYKQPCKMTVGEWLDIWLGEYLGGVKPRTVEAYCCQIKNHIRPGLGSIKLDQLKPHTVQRFYNLCHQSLSAKSVKNIHGILHRALQQAVAVGYLTSNPTAACVLPRVEKKADHSS